MSPGGLDCLSSDTHCLQTVPSIHAGRRSGTLNPSRLVRPALFLFLRFPCLTFSRSSYVGCLLHGPHPDSCFYSFEPRLVLSPSLSLSSTWPPTWPCCREQPTLCYHKRPFDHNNNFFQNGGFLISTPRTYLLLLLVVWGFSLSPSPRPARVLPSIPCQSEADRLIESP